MTAPVQQNQEQKQNDKEINFRMQEKALREKFERDLAQERAEKEKLMQELQQRQQPVHEDEPSDEEPYVDHKRLSKTLSSFEKKLEEKIERKAEEKARQLMDAERSESWLRNNPDFYEVMQHAEKFALKDPDLAESILSMPDTFERKKLVYKNIKALGIHKPEQKAPSVQETIDAKKKSPYYQPSEMGTAPYGNTGDFSKTGQKAAYDRMKELQSRLRG